MDKLFEAAKFYRENLEGRKFHLTAAKKEKIIEFDIIFGVENFKHLLGLNKLIDLQIGKISSEAGYLQILDGKTDLSDIEKSEFFYLVQPRLDNFKEIKSTLNGKELMVKSLHGEFNCIRADFMLTKKKRRIRVCALILKGCGRYFPRNVYYSPR